MNEIKDYIEAQAELKAAEAKLATAKLNATKYIRNAGYNSVNTDGYKVTLKEYRRPKVKTTEEIELLEQQLQDEYDALIEDNAEAIYKLQQQSYVIKSELHQLTHNGTVLFLQKEIAAKKEALAAQSESYYDVTCKFDPKSAHIESLICPHDYNYLIVEGKKLKDVCGKGLAKSSVASFIMTWHKSGSTLPIKEAWKERVAEHVAYWKKRGG